MPILKELIAAFIDRVDEQQVYVQNSPEFVHNSGLFTKVR